MKPIAIVPARGGSRGVPRKNLRTICGVSLVERALDVATRCPSIRCVVLSTDDEEIADVGRRIGGVTVVMRPAHLAADDIPVLPVVQDVLRILDSEEAYDSIVVLQPTNPFREPEHIEAALQRLEETGADAVVSVHPVAEHPWRARQFEGDFLFPLFPNEDYLAQRQDLSPIYYLNGAVIAARRDAVLSGATFYGETIAGLVVPRLVGFDIDEEDDLVVAEALWKRHRGDSG